VSNVVDPIVASLIRRRPAAIVEEMGAAMLRTSYSQILNSSRDFSTAIRDLDGRLIAQAEHPPIHIGALPHAAKAVTAFFTGDIRPGDVFPLNDPYHRAAAYLTCLCLGASVLFHRHEFRPDSGGAGKYRGGPAGSSRWSSRPPSRPPATPPATACATAPAASSAQGRPTHRYKLYSSGAPPRPIKTKETGVMIQPGDVLILESGDGGGWGNPADRRPAAIATDLENGFVTK
jgi:N-methylhydantoinase B/oxoprolinase/acetone carboxylase alpha subunit